MISAPHFRRVWRGCQCFSNADAGGVFGTADCGEEPEAVDELQQLAVGVVADHGRVHLSQKTGFGALPRGCRTPCCVFSSHLIILLCVHCRSSAAQSPCILRSHVRLRHLLVPVEMRPQGAFEPCSLDEICWHPLDGRPSPGVSSPDGTVSLLQKF